MGTLGLGTKRVLKFATGVHGGRDPDYWNGRDDAVPTMQGSLSSEVFRTVSLLHFYSFSLSLS